MSRGQNPLVLMMALSLPGAAHALGLGEIHVNSALNEPLVAEIDILGATAEELSSLTASIANPDTFLRFGAERPAFLASATFKVSHDVTGRPVLVIRSTDSFTEPVVNLLVDLRWHNSEVIRQYSLLLDPTGFHAATDVAAAAPSPVVAFATPALPQAAAVTNTLAAAATPIAPPHVTASPAARTTRATTHVKIGAKATLRGVAWRVGARSDSDLKKTMLAIFRANPNAFEGNVNRLRQGAVLTIPSAADISTISKEDAGREIHAQMTAWRSAPQRARAVAAPAQAMPVPAQAMPALAQAVPATVPAADVIKAGGDAAEAAALNLRVQSLEHGLHDIQGQLQRENDKLLRLLAQVKYAEEAVKLPVAAPAPRRWLLPSLIGGLGLLAGAFGAMLLKLRRRAMPKISAGGAQAVRAPIVDETSKAATNLVAARKSARDEQEAKAGEQISAAVNTEMAAQPKPVSTVIEDELRAAFEDTLNLAGETAVLVAEIAAASGDTAGGDTANMPAAVTAQHVQMPSVLHERVVASEQRTNLVDALKKAVEREPERCDLRMKLLETYYAAAAANRQAFLDVVENLARDRDRLGEGEWDKIAFMGKQIAADAAVFSPDSEAEDDELADCA